MPRWPGTVRHLWPYIWPHDRADLRMRIFLAVVLLLAAKLVTIAIPYSFKWATDALTGEHGHDSLCRRCSPVRSR